jgi:alkylation response protein AidB-like acyl-CoA dehydrogenase
MLASANLAFSLCPMLTDGVIEALLTVATPEQQQRLIPPLLSGAWTGTMNLTEPQAGSDLARVRCRAERQEDGRYKLFGTKIYITYGDHDLADNILHLVLARTADAPAGVKGLSLFIVPKYLMHADGALGERNDVQCISLEHKLGIHASPTAVLQFGEHEGAWAELIGVENRGLEYMFIMMNAARFAVGMQGVAMSQRAYQAAVAYAKQRIQGTDLLDPKSPVAIIQHPDIKRILMTMRALTEGARSMAYVVAAACDLAHHHPEEKVRQENKAFYELMVPVVKGYCTETAVQVASLGLQVHGGMGFIEDTGVAQYYRDVRITTIYEGTTAIQANDLINRKTLLDKGAALQQLCQKIIATEKDLCDGDRDMQAIALRLSEARKTLERVVEYVLAHSKTDKLAVFAGSVPYLQLLGIVVSGWQLARAMILAKQRYADDEHFYQAKIITAQFFVQTILNQVHGLGDSIMQAGQITGALDIAHF